MVQVSVAICCYNSERHLSETIESVVRQTYANWELVIVNDGSADRTHDIVQSYIRAGCPIVYHKQSNQGFGAARNKCIELARGKYIALLDHDDLYLPHRLESQVALAERSPGVGLFFSNTEHFMTNGAMVRHQFDRCDPCAFDLSAVKATNELLIHGCFIDTESVLFRREVALDVGGFSASYRYMADYDFFLKVSEKYALLAAPQVLARWRIHEDQASQSMKGIMYREHIDLLKDWGNRPFIGPEARRAATLTLFVTLVRYAGLLWRQGKLSSGWKSLAEAFRLRLDREILLRRVGKKLFPRLRVPLLP
jgi:glycosyltransferase involved in cell wall biosynthesis